MTHSGPLSGAPGPAYWRGSDGKKYHVGSDIPRGVRLAAPGAENFGPWSGGRTFIRAAESPSEPAADDDNLFADRLRALKPAAFARTVDRTAAGENGAQWARRLQGVPSAAVKLADDGTRRERGGDDLLAIKARALGYGADARDAEGESGAEMARRLGYGKKGNGR